MGIGEFSPVDLRKFLSGKIANASVSLNSLSARVNGRSTIKDAETMFQLMYLLIFKTTSALAQQQFVRDNLLR